MKLTKEILNTLIAEVLNERSYSMDDMYSPARNLMSPQNTFDTLRRLTDPEQVLTDEDFEYLKDNIEAFDTDIQRRLISIQKSDDASPELVVDGDSDDDDSDDDDSDDDYSDYDI